MVDRDIVKSMTDICDGGAYIKQVIEAYWQHQRRRMWIETTR